MRYNLTNNYETKFLFNEDNRQTNFLLEFKQTKYSFRIYYYYYL